METVTRAIETLNTISKATSGLTLTELSDRLRLPKSTVYRMLQVLVEHDFVRKDIHTKTYRLGPALLRLCTNSLNQWNLRSIALPYLQQLADTTKETVFLTALHGDTAICLQTIPSERSLQFFVRTGREMPFHCAASAKVILAYQSDKQIERILNDKPPFELTSRTITNIDELKEHLENVRRQGYALCDGEMEVGVRAIAAPIIDGDSKVIGSVAIVAPSERLDQGARKQLLPQLLHTTQEISRRLGYCSASPNADTTLTSDGFP